MLSPLIHQGGDVAPAAGRRSSVMLKCCCRLHVRIIKAKLLTSQYLLTIGPSMVAMRCVRQVAALFSAEV